jgi:hypothetical protein
MVSKNVQAKISHAIHIDLISLVLKRSSHLQSSFFLSFTFFLISLKYSARCCQLSVMFSLSCNRNISCRLIPGIPVRHKIVWTQTNKYSQIILRFFFFFFFFLSSPHSNSLFHNSVLNRFRLSGVTLY